MQQFCLNLWSDVRMILYMYGRSYIAIVLVRWAWGRYVHDIPDAQFIPCAWKYLKQLVSSSVAHAHFCIWLRWPLANDNFNPCVETVHNAALKHVHTWIGIGACYLICIYWERWGLEKFSSSRFRWGTLHYFSLSRSHSGSKDREAQRLFSALPFRKWRFHTDKHNGMRASRSP